MSFWLPSQRHISILDLKTSKEAIVSSLSPPIYRNNRQGNPGIQGPQENEGLGLPKYSELKSQGSTVSGAGAEWFWTTPARRTGRWLEWIELDFGCGGGIGCEDVCRFFSQGSELGSDAFFVLQERRRTISNLQGPFLWLEAPRTLDTGSLKDTSQNICLLTAGKGDV